jgi:hypothetical protein
LPARFFYLAAPCCLAALAAPSFVACGGDDDDSAEPAAIGVLLTPGLERDAWDREPAPARVVVKTRVVQAGATEEQEVTLADQPWPFESVSAAGLSPNWSALFSVEVFDAAGALIMRGETPFFGTNAAFGRELPVLVGRQGEFARPSQGLIGAWLAPKTALFGGRYVLLAGGAGAGEGGGTEFFDLVTLTPLVSNVPLPRVPASLLTDGQVGLFLDAGGASTHDLFEGTSAPYDLGNDDVAAELAGGDTVLSDDDARESFIVGATRPGAATTAVLRVSAEGPRVIRLATPRERAGAIWVKGRGLVIVGGAAGAPIEVLAPKASSFKPLEAQSPTIFEPSLASTPSGDVLELGGVDAAGVAVSPQRLALGCTGTCPATAEAISPSAPLLRAGRPFDVGRDGHWLVIGNDAEGFSSALLVDATTTPVGVTPVATRVRRKGASSLAVGGGYVALLGGADAAGTAVPDIEIFTPPAP